MVNTMSSQLLRPMSLTRLHSDPHEEQIIRRFREVGIDFKMKDKSSGSARADGDGLSRDFFLSCKFRSQKGFSLTSNDYKKDRHQAARYGRTPIWALRNQAGDDIVMMRLDDFLRIVDDADSLKEVDD